MYLKYEKYIIIIIAKNVPLFTHAWVLNFDIVIVHHANKSDEPGKHEQ